MHFIGFKSEKHFILAMLYNVLGFLGGGYVVGGRFAVI